MAGNKGDKKEEYVASGSLGKMEKQNITKANKKKNGMVRAKSAFFRTARYGLTLQEHRVIYYAILANQQRGTAWEPVTLSILEFQELMELKAAPYNQLRSVSKRLLTKVVEYFYEDEKGQHLLQMQWVSQIRYNLREGTVDISLNPGLQTIFEGRPFTEAVYQYLIHFTSQYAERMYEIIKSTSWRKELLDFDIEDLRRRLGLGEDQYRNYSDFNRFVLRPAIEDINRYTDVSVEVKEKRGRYNKVESLYFSIKVKKILENLKKEK